MIPIGKVRMKRGRHSEFSDFLVTPAPLSGATPLRPPLVKEGGSDQTFCCGSDRDLAIYTRVTEQQHGYQPPPLPPTRHTWLPPPPATYEYPRARHSYPLKLPTHPYRYTWRQPSLATHGYPISYIWLPTPLSNKWLPHQPKMATPIFGYHPHQLHLTPFSHPHGYPLQANICSYLLVSTGKGIVVISGKSLSPFHAFPP
jgi:hypothetical protein